MKVTVTAGLDRGLVLQLASYFSTFVQYINFYTYHDWHDCYLWSEGLGYWFYLASDKSVWACQHSSTACIQLVWDYCITGNFSWCKILRKCCIHFRRNFRGFCFHVSRTWQLTTPLKFKAVNVQKIDTVANLPQARHFFTKNSGPAIPACRLGSLSPSPKMKTTKTISSAILLLVELM